MKVNPDAPAHPSFEANETGYGDTISLQLGGSTTFLPFTKGMNIRTQIAAMAMQGMLANPSEDRVSATHVIEYLGLPKGISYVFEVHWPQYIAKKSLMHADGLIAELNK